MGNRKGDRMDIPDKVWGKNGEKALVNFLNSLPAGELKDVGLLHQYIVGNILPKFFREGFRAGCKCTALELCKTISDGSLN